MPPPTHIPPKAKYLFRPYFVLAAKTSLGCGSKLNRRGKPQVLIHVSTYQGNPFWYRYFEPQPLVYVLPLLYTAGLLEGWLRAGRRGSRTRGRKACDEWGELDAHCALCRIHDVSSIVWGVPPKCSQRLCFWFPCRSTSRSPSSTLSHPFFGWEDSPTKHRQNRKKKEDRVPTGTRSFECVGEKQRTRCGNSRAAPPAKNNERAALAVQGARRWPKTTSALLWQFKGSAASDHK